METYYQEHDQQVFGHLVTTFPNGVGEAFDKLMENIPGGDKRSYYGISKMDDKGSILYWVAAQETAAGEAERYGYERFVIQQGEYVSEKIFNWKEKLECIKDVFHELMQDASADPAKVCIEWYYAKNEMMCMLQKK